MAEIRFISGEAALRAFIDGYSSKAQDELDRRNINASGRLRASHRVEVFSDQDSTTGSLYGLSYWTKAGSGSPPGTVADLTGLKEWLLNKGLIKDLTPPERIAALIQDKIYREGSRDFRERNPNVYRQVAEGYRDKVRPVVQAFLRDVSSPMSKSFTASFKVA